MVQARNTASEHEFSLRLAIGAGQGSIFRQLLCESILLVGAGAGLGWLFADFGDTAACSVVRHRDRSESRHYRLALHAGHFDSRRADVQPGAAVVAQCGRLWPVYCGPLPTTPLRPRNRVLAGRDCTFHPDRYSAWYCSWRPACCCEHCATMRRRILASHAENLLVFGVTPQGASTGICSIADCSIGFRQVPGVESVSDGQQPSRFRMVRQQRADSRWCAAKGRDSALR